MGNCYGTHGFDTLTEAKPTLISPLDVGAYHLFPPFTLKKVEDVRQLSQFRPRFHRIIERKYHDDDH
jgi:hypothetical protein